MPLTAKQQKNVEILIDQHFDGVRRDLQNGRGATGWPKVESTPELQQLAETHATVLELQDRQALDALKIYNDALTSLGFDTQPVPYALSSPTPQTTERRAEHLVQLVINTTRNRLARTTYVQDRDPPAKNPLLYGPYRSERYITMMRNCTLARMEFLGW